MTTPALTDETAVLIAAAQQLTAEQLDEFKAGRLLVTPAMQQIICAVHRVPPPAVAAAIVAHTLNSPQPAARSEQEKWLDSQDAYDAARARAEAAGASPANLNALMQPGEQTLPCGLVMRPLSLSGYVFLEAVGSPFVTGGNPTPADLLFLALAVVCPEDAAGCVKFNDDFCPQISDPGTLSKLLRDVGGRVGAADVPRLMRHAGEQMRQMFPERAAESEGASPLDPAKVEEAAA
jgi:hypothetical protein